MGRFSSLLCAKNSSFASPSGHAACAVWPRGDLAMEDGHAEHSHRHGGRGIGFCRQRRGRTRQRHSRATGLAVEDVDAFERDPDRAAGQGRTQTYFAEDDQNHQAFPPPRDPRCDCDGRPGTADRAGAGTSAHHRATANPGTGDMVGADQALALGIANRTVADEQLVAEMLKWFDQYVKHAPPRQAAPVKTAAK